MKDVYREGPYPFFTCAENHIFSKSYSFDTEAILVAGNANVGLAKYCNGKFEAYQGNRTYVLTDFANIDVPYLYSILSNSLRPALLAQVQTSAKSYIRLPMLQAFELAVPTSLHRAAEDRRLPRLAGRSDRGRGRKGRRPEAAQAGFVAAALPPTRRDRAAIALPRLPKRGGVGGRETR